MRRRAAADTSASSTWFQRKGRDTDEQEPFANLLIELQTRQRSNRAIWPVSVRGEAVGGDGRLEGAGIPEGAAETTVVGGACGPGLFHPLEVGLA